MCFKKWLSQVQQYFERLDPPASRLSRSFLCLWALSFYLNYAESWYYPELTFCIFGICLVALLFKNLKWAWALYLAFSTSLLVYKFPILANHSIFNLFVNIYLLYRLAKNSITSLDLGFSKTLLLSLVGVYFWAALHKVNVDYLYNETSCALSFMGRINRSYFGGALPQGLAQHGIIPIATVLLEFLIAVFLLRKKTFYLGLIFAVTFHMILAALEFIDFSMNSLSILVLAIGFFSFSSKEKFQKITCWIPYYVVAQLLSGVVSYFESDRGRGTVGYHLQTFFFVSFSLWVLYCGAKITYGARNERDSKYSWGSYILPAWILIFGSFNYIGLSTAGTFSMFSNIRTEGSTWNHLLIPKFVRIIPYQDKIYWVKNLDEKSERANREHPRINYGMPEIEFYRALRIWKENGQEPEFIEYELDGVTRRVEGNLGNHLFEGRTYSWLEQKLLFFRRIQREDRPNKCRW